MNMERNCLMDHFVQCKEGPVTVLTLTRPPINALDRMALEELAEAVERVRSDPESRVLVLTGGIDGIFCSGGDLKYWQHVHDGREVSCAGRNVFDLIERLPKPTIAAINGHVIGDGLALALVCDLRISSATATFRLPEAAYGFIPGWGFIKRLVASVGRGNASGLLLTGQSIGASRAKTMGLVNEIVSPDQLMNHVMSVSRQLAALSPSSLQALKCVLSGGDERACFEAVWGKEDWREGIDALVGKRPPAFDRISSICCELGELQRER
jgi:enoyl-CoA hydratase/carnithine racemase